MAPASALALWQQLGERYRLSSEQLLQFQAYALLLQNAPVNVTALHELEDIIWYHFADSLELGKCIDLQRIRSVADIGTGGGLPGIALKIAYPHLKMLLVEVVGKKREFLASVVTQLGLEHVTIEGKDWRTLLRTAPEPVDLVCSRAALAPTELVRMFQPSSLYRNAQLVYWASSAWAPEQEVQKWVQREYAYQVGNKERRLIVMSATK